MRRQHALPRGGESGLLVQSVVGPGPHEGGLSQAFALACGAPDRFKYLGDGLMEGGGALARIADQADLADGWVVLGSRLPGATTEVVAQAAVLLALGLVVLEERLP